MIEIAMTPDQYQKARRVIATASEVTSFTEAGANAGSFTTSLVSMTYTYDGTSTLALVVVKKFSYAVMATEGKIKSRLEGLLGRL